MIAAIAKVNQLTVVTRNVADFSGFGEPLASSDAQLVTEACGRAAQELGLDREST